MGRGIGQADLVVLALHLHQRRTQALEQGDAHRLVVDEGAAAAIGLHHAAQHQLVLGRHVLVPQDGETGMVGRRVEAGGDRGLRLSRAHRAGFGTRAQREPQRIEQDGLARACFAGQHRQSWREGKVQALDQHHIANGERG